VLLEDRAEEAMTFLLRNMALEEPPQAGQEVHVDTRLRLLVLAVERHSQQTVVRLVRQVELEVLAQRVLLTLGL
jgi:hypothetical protein